MAKMGLTLGNLTAKTSTIAYRTFLRPMMEYGLALDAIPKNEQKRLHRTQTFCLNLLFRTARTTSHGALHLNCGLPTMATRAKVLGIQCRARWEDVATHDDKMIALITRFIRSTAMKDQPYLGKPFYESIQWNLTCTRKEKNATFSMSMAFAKDDDSTTDRTQILSVKTLMLTHDAHTSFKRGQQLTAACTPRTKMSGVWTQLGPSIPRRLHVVMVWWRLGAFTWHPHGKYRLCKKCKCNGEGRIELSRSHAQTCVDEEDTLDALVQGYKDIFTGWTEPETEGVGPIDKLLDMLGEVGKLENEEPIVGQAFNGLWTDLEQIFHTLMWRLAGWQARPGDIPEWDF
ncbi:uncharacterized protein BJ171DRAFT_517722 [Polychytrium aggregatum]|uniref:uncharacterized protein n=1 Tax=Polychytrium aggregatum TaxID=110093 RepID=UPI0022FE0057|nr:uncharacterized protein BJ171DRAFT_517722 [Polychytrium aggregatum]KAI9199766.1 hypothetical protein BJ171DRAFT_517722 [Polychytrium aggregatum]